MRAKFLVVRTLPVVIVLGLISSLAVGQTLKPAEIRARFHTLLNRKRVPLEPILTPSNDGPLIIIRGTFRSDKRERVPFFIVRPTRTNTRLPAVILLHGTGGNKEGMEPLARELAQTGFLAVAIDARYHGERIEGGAHGAKEYNEAIIRAWRERDLNKQEHPFYYDTVYDLHRTVDYLITRPDVDRRRIGMLGISMGGIETWLAAATDERIAVAVPLIGVQSLRWSLENQKWQGRANTIKSAHEAAAADLGEKEVNSKVCRALWSKVIPGILDEFDCPNMLRCIAPRPLLVLNGEKDPNCPLEGAKLAFDAAEGAYKAAKAKEKLKIDVAVGIAHAVTPEHKQMALEWLKKWLKP